MNYLLFKIKIIQTASIFLLVFSSVTMGRIQLLTRDSTVNLGISSAGWLESGQIIKGYILDGRPIDHQWLQKSCLNLVIDAKLSERIQIAAGVEGAMFLNAPKGGASSQQYYIWRLNSIFIVDRAYGSYSWGDPAYPLLSVTAGRYPYKYNQEARNLGEYLFRSGTYPAYLINNFDLPFARLTGLKLSSNLFYKLHQDLMLTFETEIPPYYDASLSYIADYTIGKFLNIGAGVEFAHLISVDERQTTPKNTRTLYDSTPSYYTFRGTKIMARLSFDPKPFIPFNAFGREDLKIFAEAAVLGLEEYPANDSLNSFTSTKNNIWGYDTLKNKIPVVFGMNIPAFKILDVLSAEFEWYGCPYPNNYATELGKGNLPSLPLPDFFGRSDRGYVVDDNWKWSFYAKKMFAHDRLGVILQIARDHMRIESLLDEAKYYNLEESLGLKDHWWWSSKIYWAF